MNPLTVSDDLDLGAWMAAHNLAALEVRVWDGMAVWDFEGTEPLRHRLVELMPHPEQPQNGYDRARCRRATLAEAVAWYEQLFAVAARIDEFDAAQEEAKARFLDDLQTQHGARARSAAGIPVAGLTAIPPPPSA